MLPPEEYFPCLHPVERDQIIGVVTAFVGGTLILTELQYTLITLVSGMGWNSRRFVCFNWIYQAERVPTGLPPPLDYVWEFTDAIWSPLYDFYFDVVVEGNEPECDIWSFKGNQGGAWPILWP